MNDKDIRVRTTPVFKLKDRERRNYQAINLVKQFGFQPEVIIVEKVPGINNGIIVRAILTPEEIKKENAVKANIIPRRKVPLASK